MYLLRLVLAIALLLPFSVQAAPLTLLEKLSDFESLVTQIRSGYGPLEYKRDVVGIDLDIQAEEFRERIKATTSNGEYYYLVVEFVASFKDGHFGALVPTDHKATLPFTADLVGDKIVIDTIDRDQLPEAKFPFERGDEIVMFDGKPIAEEIAGISKYISSGFERSVKRFAAWTLTNRRGQRLPVRQGKVGETKILHAQTGRVETVAADVLEWKEEGEPLDELLSAETGLGRSLSDSFVQARINFDSMSVRDLYASYIGEERLERSFMCSGGTRINIPEGAEIIMNTPEAPFVAYYHHDERFGGNVGYLRIPHYFPQTKDGEPAYEERFAQYEYAVQVLEENTVGLIIDQDHNCGGSVMYLEEVLGLFMTEPYEPMQFKLLATKESILDFQEWMNSLPEFTIARTDLEKVLKLVKDTYAAGESFLTEKTSISGVERMYPNRVRYTKPIIVLIDELAGSGGDAFPSIMGHERAKLLGTRTSGLGGHVVDTDPLPYSQLRGRYTKSLFFRPDGVAVENNGAVPDEGFSYTHTYNDFVDGYREYQQFYLQKLLEMVQAD